MKSWNRLLGLLAIGCSLVACAADPQGTDDAPETELPTAAEEAAPAPAPSGETSRGEHLGQSKEELKWERPFCSFIRWPCGGCICDACNVVDCRGATTLAP